MAIAQVLARNPSQHESPYLRSGKVARIVLKNFMCHSNFAVDFNDHINVMVGKNGSGKSAVLTALILGLGSKTSATSRSSTLTRTFTRSLGLRRSNKIVYVFLVLQILSSEVKLPVRLRSICTTILKMATRLRSTVNASWSYAKCTPLVDQRTRWRAPTAWSCPSHGAI